MIDVHTRKSAVEGSSLRLVCLSSRMPALLDPDELAEYITSVTLSTLPCAYGFMSAPGLNVKKSGAWQNEARVAVRKSQER